MKVARLLFLCVFLLVFAAQSVILAQSWPSPCVPGISSNPIVMENLCNEPPPAKAVPAVAHPIAPAPILTLSAERLSRVQLDDFPTIQPGDVMVFEANRRDFVLRTQISNGKEIVVGPITVDEAEDTSVAWRKGRVKLDYPEVVGQKVVHYSVTVLHETGTPLLFRGVKIYRAGTMMLELEPASPRPKRNPAPRVEPPFRYPADPVLVASLHQPPLSLHVAASVPTGFVRTTLPQMQPMMVQSTTTTTSADPNHFKWNGKEFDVESGLLNFGARYYSPALGRFMTPDPKIMSAQRMFDPQQWNMYAYGRNNPTTFADPDGKELRLATDMSKKDAQRITKSLVEVYRKPGGAQRIERLAQSSILYTVGSGDLKGEGYGLTQEKGERDRATGKIDPSSISVKITVDLQQKDVDQTDFEHGVRPSSPPSEENTMTEEIVHADIIDHDPVGQVGKPPNRKEAEAKSGIDEISKQKKGDAGKAKDRVNEILRPDKKKPED